MYRRDVGVNSQIQSRDIKKNPKRVINVNFKVQDTLVSLGLIPGVTVVFLIDDDAYWALRTYTIDSR